jgi:hypothetical protein
MSIDSFENTTAPEAAEGINISGKAEFILDMETPDLGERVSEVIATAEGFKGVVNSEVIGVHPECKLRIITSFQEMGTVSEFINKIKAIILRCKEAMVKEAERCRDAIISSLLPKPNGSDPASA